MYTVYKMKDLDKLAKNAVDRIFKNGCLSYRNENWEISEYDFTIDVPVDMPTDEYYPMLNITVVLSLKKHVTIKGKKDLKETITFAEYL